MFLSCKRQLIFKTVTRGWNVEMLFCSCWTERQSGEGMGEDGAEPVSGFKAQWCTAWNAKGLHSFEGNILSERDRAVGVERSTPEHIHFTVFSSNLPLDIASLPLKAIILPFAIIYVSKPPLTHILTLCVHSAQGNEPPASCDSH